MTQVTDGPRPQAFNRAVPTFQENTMQCNIGKVERGVRIAAGLALVALSASGTVGWWGWLGLVPLATGALGWCPPYAMLGISTCAVRSKD